MAERGKDKYEVPEMGVCLSCVRDSKIITAILTYGKSGSEVRDSHGLGRTL